MQTVESYLLPDTKGIHIKLKCPWIVYMRYNLNDDWKQNPPIALYRFSTVGGFWFVHQVLEEYMDESRTYFVMREGVSPSWEDASYVKPSYCIVECNNNTYQRILLRCLMCLVLEIVTDGFSSSNIKGLSFVYESSYKIIKFWVSNAILDKSNISSEIIDLVYDQSNVPSKNRLYGLDMIRVAPFKARVDRPAR
jgi:hypothetical protein